MTAVLTRTSDQWRRLDWRTIAITTATLVGFTGVSGFSLASVVSWIFGWSLASVLAWLVPGVVLIVAAGFVGDWLRWTRTRYRLSADRLEMHTGVFVRKQRSLPRDRIRSVDISAGIMLRLCGMAKVEIGTGEHVDKDKTSLELDAVSRAEADRLRRELLGQGPAGESDDQVLAELDRRWVWYAPLSVEAFVLGSGAFGGLLSVAELFGFEADVLTWTYNFLDSMPLAVAILIVVVVGGVVGAVGALLLFVTTWWDYRLDRESAGTLRVRRGLMTTHSVSLTEERLRGVQVVETLGHRLLGAAKVDAVATGLAEEEHGEESDHKTLLPNAPAELAHQVAASVVNAATSPTDPSILCGHVTAARNRRLTWATMIALVPATVLAVLGLLLTDVLLHIAWSWALVALGIGLPAAVDAYRNLGHAISGRYLVSRHGGLWRKTVALQRDGVIGWTISQSVFQRRKGLVTLTATTSAGRKRYSVYDVEEHKGLAFADTCVPGLIAQFLDPQPPS
ncbi:PH domain-containing protein [Kibdelosporangium persicum]|uniref:Transmembrane protein, ydbT n=1 Tax=Kibdelosporangium persicum TaxID=2698649 RepID=A0ABX2F9D2_9PSEU|nr:PH domain-containing protein [Kibdelosporangium persicum]NRN67971.1 Transmembrane protein, ydbT [Kibdelosporangium persicum]